MGAINPDTGLTGYQTAQGLGAIAWALGPQSPVGFAPGGGLAWLPFSPELAAVGGMFEAAGELGSEATLLSPGSINFSQRSIGSDWSSIAESMRTSGWQGSAIDVVRMSDGSLTTVDNTRLFAASQAGIDVLANVRGFSDPIGDMAARFTNSFGVPTTWGDAVTFRIQNQGALFSNTYPLGAPITGVK